MATGMAGAAVEVAGAELGAAVGGGSGHAGNARVEWDSFSCDRDFGFEFIANTFSRLGVAVSGGGGGGGGGGAGARRGPTAPAAVFDEP